jgi:ComF family protein
MSPYTYSGEVREKILAMKFKGEKHEADHLGKLLAGAVQRNIHEHYDYITWVPAGGERLQERGYDQAEQIARSMSACLCKEAKQSLARAKEAPPMSDLEAEERKKAAEGMYEATCEAKGKAILLVDDVITTGTTLEECAKALRRAGAEKVICAVVATTAGLPPASKQPGAYDRDRAKKMEMLLKMLNKQRGVKRT